jgi:hypothetical protein
VSLNAVVNRGPWRAQGTAATTTPCCARATRRRLGLQIHPRRAGIQATPPPSSLTLVRARRPAPVPPAQPRRERVGRTRATSTSSVLACSSCTPSMTVCSTPTPHAIPWQRARRPPVIAPVRDKQRTLSERMLCARRDDGVHPKQSRLKMIIPLHPRKQQESRKFSSISDAAATWVKSLRDRQ